MVPQQQEVPHRFLKEFLITFIVVVVVVVVVKDGIIRGSTGSALDHKSLESRFKLQPGNF